jgi:hypothetical protein
MNITDFERKVWEVDRLRVIVRAPNDATVQDFTQRIAAGQGQRLTEYLEARIYPRVAPYEVTIVSGDGSLPRLRTLVGTVRQSYIR